MTLRLRIQVFALAGGLIAAMPLCGQMHKVSKPETVVRAIGVYEWTGEMAKPSRSRIIPVSLFIDGRFQDAGVYMARPVPFALETGTVFELEQAGVPKGTVQLSFATHLTGVGPKGESTPYEDGWFAYGAYKPLQIAKPKPSSTQRQAHAAVVTNGSVDTSDPDTPVLLRKNSGDVAAKSTDRDASQGADPERPTLSRKGASSGDAAADDTAPPADPDRPTLKKKSVSPDTAADADTPPPADPDRPTLRKRSASASASADTDNGYGLGDPSLNNDPSRPTLHRGKPTGALTAEDLPKLTGLPPDLHQMVAVSDAANRPEHKFARAWESEAERTTIVAKMQEIARAKVLADSNAVQAAPVKATPVPTTLAAKRKAAAAAKAAEAAAASIQFADEDLRGYELSYGGLPTYVYTASAGTSEGGAVRYVAVVAQADGLGELKPALTSVTDATHLDRTPRFKLVDVVDAEASNRASLLVELRAQHSRQFALYRVIGTQAEQIFITGDTQ